MDILPNIFVSILGAVPVKAQQVGPADDFLQPMPVAFDEGHPFPGDLQTLAVEDMVELIGDVGVGLGGQADLQAVGGEFMPLLPIGLEKGRISLSVVGRNRTEILRKDLSVREMTGLAVVEERVQRLVQEDRDTVDHPLRALDGNIDPDRQRVDHLGQMPEAFQDALLPLRDDLLRPPVPARLAARQHGYDHTDDKDCSEFHSGSFY